jgi:hypothetical protein
MSTRYFGQRIKRNEDPAVLTGEATTYITHKKSRSMRRL